MSNPNEVRDTVRNSYGERIKSVTKSGGGCCSTTPGMDGQVSKYAGYSSDELSAVPEEAAGSTFGCGNPVALSQIGEGETVLDLGSGAGLDLLLAAQKVGASGKVIGIDMTDEMIEQARANIDKAGATNVEVRKGIIEEMPVDDASVDWVISNCVINLSPEKDRAFAEIARVLKPGGRFVISDIVAEEIPDWMANWDFSYNSCIGGAISEADYIAGLEQAGLADVTVLDRLVYGQEHLDGFINAELNKDQELPTGCCGAQAGGELVRRMVEPMVGKVWSAKFHGRKP